MTAAAIARNTESASTPALVSWRVYTIVVLEGFVSIALEILAMRQALPFIGSSIVITSSIIGAFLLFLSFGYYVGGVRSGKILEKLCTNLLVSQVLVVCGLSTFFLAFLSKYTANDTSFLLGLLAFVVCPGSFLLGQTIPLLSNFLVANDLSRFSGKILFLSTVGSFFGSVFTAAILMNLVGVSHTITIASLILTFLIYLMSGHARISLKLYFSVLLTILSFALFNNPSVGFFNTLLNEDAKRLIFPVEYENAFSTVSVTEWEGVNYLSINGNDSSSYNTQTDATEFWYSYIIDEHLKDYSGLNVLVAGAGGFTIGINDANNFYTYVDIDPDLRKVSEEKLLERKINGSFVVEDVRGFLTRNTKKYDVIISDVYHGKTLPASLITREYFSLLVANLVSDGTGRFFVNTISKGDLSSIFSVAINNTLSSIAHCLGLLTEHETVTTEQTNVLYFCRPKRHEMVFTDDKVNELLLLDP